MGWQAVWEKIYLPPTSHQASSSGLLLLSSNLTCLWNEKAWSWLSHWAAPHTLIYSTWKYVKYFLAIDPVLLLEAATEGNVAWPASDSSKCTHLILQSSEWIVDVPRSLCCRIRFVQNSAAPGTLDTAWSNCMLHISIPLISVRALNLLLIT